MPDYIEREQAVTVFKTFYGKSLRIMLEALAEEHAADVRPVVLCRECKHWELSKIAPSFYVCTYVCGTTFVRKADDFCSRGERREES